MGYLSIYGDALRYTGSVEQTLEGVLLMPAWLTLPLVIVSAMCGIAVRLYLLSAVGLDHRETGVKFRRLFPALLVLDALWASSPLLLVPKIPWAIALACVVGLAYLPFSQRTLIQQRLPLGDGATLICFRLEPALLSVRRDPNGIVTRQQNQR